MFVYQWKEKICISRILYPDFKQVSLDLAVKQEALYYLMEGTPGKWRKSFFISDPSLMFMEEEDLSLLMAQEVFLGKTPKWLQKKIQEGRVKAINTSYPQWEEFLEQSLPRRWRVHIFGMGDVGGTLLTGLRLLGGDTVEYLGIYDRREEKVKRWEYEANQILSPDKSVRFPPVKGISLEQLFDCDLFVFCASTGVPELGTAVKDVRMVQLEGNREMMKPYVRMAREKKFKGIFAVVSDPVDPLCKAVFLDSNTNPEYGELDYQGLAPEQIRGYGLGVMDARAAFYAGQDSKACHYLQEGRAYGPHGQDLVIADSIENYQEDISLYLTVKARTANLEVRDTGFKPYVAPALSSGTFSLLATMKGEWHYSATFMGGVYMGARNRLTPGGTEIERLPLPPDLWERLQTTYERLGNIL